MARVLVVEDEEHIQRLIEVLLQKNQMDVVKAFSGEQCLKILQDDKNFHLIMLDILMPGVDGLQVLRQIKLDLSLAQIPIIMLTALSQENVVLKGIKLGANDYIRKPFHPKELLNRIRQHLKLPNQ